jgi:thiamine-phosphate pyrophosphorylase
MRARYPFSHARLPRIWLLTDERQGEALWPALAKLPRGSGVIMRHYSLHEKERRALFTRIRAITDRRRLTLLLSADPRRADQWGADGSYSDANGRRKAGRLWAAAVHDLAEIRRAERQGANLLLLSPLFSTRSHPGAHALGPTGFARLARATRLPVIALGGVQARHARLLHRIGAYGWAGIDAFIPETEKAEIRT